MTRKKGALLPPHENLIPENTICISFKIPDAPEYRYAAKYQVYELGKPDHWEYRTQPDRLIVGDFIANLIFNTYVEGSCEVLMLRQKPTNSCILQQSLDNGVTWQDVFDFKKCLPHGIQDMVNNNNQNITNDLVQNYIDNGLPTTLPDVIYDGTLDDLFRDDLLCIMTQILVQSMVETELDRRRSQANDWRAAGNFIEAIGFSLAGVTGGWSILGTQIAKQWLEVAADVWVELSEAVLQDEQAQLEVACCWYENLRGTTVTASRWSNSLNGCGFQALSLEEQLRGAISPLLDTTTNEGLGFYLEFLRQLQDAMPLAKRGLFDNCGCENICQFYDFRISQHGFTLIPNVTSAFNWVETEGIHGVVTNQIGQDWNAVEIRKQFAAQDVREIRMIFDITQGTWDTTNQVVAQVGLQTMKNNVEVRSIGRAYTEQEDGTNWLIVLDNDDQEIDEIRLRVRAAQHAVITNPGSCLVKSIEVLCP